MPVSRLDEIVANKRLEVDERKRLVALSVLEGAVKKGGFAFLNALSAGKETVPIIAEVKPKSPSAGVLKAELDLDEIIRVYQNHASAISVLTDAKYFGGSLELLKTISAKVICPTLCKDFIVDPYQCYEARQAGAEAVLLIVKILSAPELQKLHDVASELGLSAVVEVQTVDELEVALSVNPSIVLINNRNLSTFEIDLSTTERLASRIPASVKVISASGVESADDVERLSPYCDAMLIGSSIMRSENIETKLSELCSVRRRARESV